MTHVQRARFGWQPDLTDPRDYTPSHERVRELLARLPRRGSTRAEKQARAEKAGKVDLREYFLEVADQGPLRSSTAQAACALVEYFERRSSGRCLELAPLFLYKVTRRLLEQTGDTGADLRATLQALARFGVPPGAYCPSDPDRFDAEPDPFLYALARDLAGVTYLRLDPPEATGPQILRTVKGFLAAGFPSVFGFAAPNSISPEADIPFPTQFDDIRGGHAVVAVGYDDDRRIRSTKGALLVRNSWGASWGDNGYGWLPFRYVEDRLAADFWTLLKPEWLDSGEFEQPL